MLIIIAFKKLFNKGHTDDYGDYKENEEDCTNPQTCGESGCIKVKAVGITKQGDRVHILCFFCKLFEIIADVKKVIVRDIF